MPTGSISNANNRFLRIFWTRTGQPFNCTRNHSTFYANSVALPILQLKNSSKSKYMNRIHHKNGVSYFSFRALENLQEEVNLSTGDKLPIPNVSFFWRFYCTLKYCLTYYRWWINLNDSIFWLGWEGWGEIALIFIMASNIVQRSIMRDKMNSMWVEMVATGFAMNLKLFIAV